MVKISKGLKKLFGVEIRNEEFGGVSPANLVSALDSWTQAPDDVLESWTEVEGKKELNLIEKELRVLIKKYKGKELSHFLKTDSGIYVLSIDET